MSAVFNAALPCAQKMVLVVIADRANDEGEGCWYSVATIATKSGMSPRAVQVQIQKLAAAGYLKRQERPGRSCHWFIDPRRLCAPEVGETAPTTPADSAYPPANGAPDPFLILKPLEANASSPVDLHRLTTPTLLPRASGTGRKPLPDDWQPGPLPATLAAAVRVMPAAWHHQQLDAMKRHCRRTGKAGRHADWQRQWVAWLWRAIDRAGGNIPLQPERSTSFEIQREELCDGLHQFRSKLVHVIGQAKYRAFFDDCEIRSEGDQIVIIAPSAFILSHIQENFTPAAQSAAFKASFRGVSFAVGRKDRNCRTVADLHAAWGSAQKRDSPTNSAQVLEIV